MNAPKYFGPNYDSGFLRLRDGTPTNGVTFTLEGMLQRYVDSTHMTLAMHSSPNDPPLSGIALEQCNRARVKAEIFRTAASYPKMYVDAVPAGKTADGLAWYYWSQARAIFDFYRR